MSKENEQRLLTSKYNIKTKEKELLPGRRWTRDSIVFCVISFLKIVGFLSVVAFFIFVLLNSVGCFSEMYTIDTDLGNTTNPNCRLITYDSYENYTRVGEVTNSLRKAYDLPVITVRKFGHMRWVEEARARKKKIRVYYFRERLSGKLVFAGAEELTSEKTNSAQ